MITTQKDGTYIVSGFEKGIASSPHLGIGDMRGVDIDSQPGAATVNFQLEALTKPPVVTTLAFSVATTDIFTVASTAGWYNGMAITLNTVVSVVGATTGRVYWVGDLTATTFKLYKNPALPAAQLVDITTAGTGTLSSYTLSAPLDSTIAYNGRRVEGALRNYEFILDSAGLVWWIANPGGTPNNTLVYIGNDTLTATVGRAINIFKEYIIVFRSSTMDALSVGDLEVQDLDGVFGWHYGFESVSAGELNPRATFVGQDDVLYFDNGGSRIGSLSENVGSSFDPTSAATFTRNVEALDLPSREVATAIGELGTTLLIGGLKNMIYPWDRVSPSFSSPIILPDNRTYRIVGTNQLAFIFSGTRGAIYVTNGSSAQLYKSVPDYVTGVLHPYFFWGDAMAWREGLYFSFQAVENDGTALTSTAGVWKIDMDTGALTMGNSLSHGTYAGTVPVLLPDILTQDPPGAGIFAGWVNSSTYGVDVSSLEPYQAYEARIDTDIIPVGTFIDKFMPNHFEFKLARALVAGEKIKLSARTSLTGNFTQIGETTTQQLSAEYDSNFQGAEWVQFRIELSSTDTDPSFIPLMEIRMEGKR